jgi:hypothetical protein
MSRPRRASRTGFEAFFAGGWPAAESGFAGGFASGWEFVVIVPTVDAGELAPGFVDTAGSEGFVPGFSSSIPSADMVAESPRPA